MAQNLATLMGMTHSFIQFNSVSESFDSTQLMTHNAFTRLDLYQLTTQHGFLKFDSNLTSTQKASSILIQINYRLKKSESWFESIHDSMMLFIPSFVWPYFSIQLCCWLGWHFLGFRLKSWLRVTFLGAFDSSAFPEKLIWISSWLKQYLGDLNRFNSWLKRFSSNWLRINSWLKWIARYWF